MQMKPYDSRSFLLRIILILFAIGALALSTIILTQLVSESGDCSLPIRTYLGVLSAALCVLAVPIIAVEAFGHSCLQSKTGLCAYALFLAVGISTIYIWQGIGLFMLSDDDDCADDFNRGYEMYLIATGCFFIAGGVALGGFMLWSTLAVLRERSGYLVL